MRGGKKVNKKHHTWTHLHLSAHLWRSLDRDQASGLMAAVHIAGSPFCLSESVVMLLITIIRHALWFLDLRKLDRKAANRFRGSCGATNKRSSLPANA